MRTTMASELLPGLTSAILTAEGGLAQIAADPIAAFRFKSEAQRNATRALSTFREVYIRSGNRAGKTHWGAHAGVALARGCPELDGVPLPVLGSPTSGVVLAKGRAMAKESVIKAYRQAVGRWPHHLEKNGNNIEAIWVKPNRSSSDEWADWSCIRFFVDSGQSVEGMRLDWVHADEPPDWPMWESLRTRGKANRPFIRFITATPLDKREWMPLREDYRGCEWPKGKNGKVEIRLSVFDNKALGPEDIAAMEEDTKGPLQKAKLYGEYVDLTGSNPFDAEGLERWAGRCLEPTRIDRWATSGGKVVEIEWWGDVQPGEQYLVVADPSSGAEDEAHENDPCESVVVSRGVKGRPAVVARYNGYIPAYELGRLSTHLAKQANGAMLVWERNSGYGEAFWLGTGGYGNVYVEQHHDARNMPLSERVGWLTTATTRGTIIGALQRAIIEDGLYVPSVKAVESLKNVVIDRNGRPEAGAHSHDEDMIVLGLACHLLATYPLYVPNTGKTQGERWLEANGLVIDRELERDPFAWPA